MKTNDCRLTPQQNLALQYMLSQANIFLTGCAGSGKSFLVKEFMHLQDPKEFPILASTGAAAVLIGGRTFHSFFGLGILEGGPESTIERALKNRVVVRRLKKIKGFILDEISMISAETLDIAEAIARTAREEDLPWGGLKVIAVGDFAQLPPVNTQKSKKQTWAFLSQAWRNSKFLPLVLTKNMRATEEELIQILNKVRIGTIDNIVKDFLNQRTIKVSDDADITRLYAHRTRTNDLNLEKLATLEGEEVEFPTIYWGDERSVEQLKKSSPIPEVLKLKEKALVMIKQNDPKQRYVNGSQAHIKKFTSSGIELTLLNGKNITLEKSTFSWLDANGAVVAAATNYPIDLAYATTIHKSQGSTLDQLCIDLTKLWEPGQAYVALSRAKTLNGLHILGWDLNSFKFSPEVASFHEQCFKFSPLNKLNNSLNPTQIEI